MNAGSIRLAPKRSFIGVRVGFLYEFNETDDLIYLSLAPKADLEFLERKLRLGFHIPLNFQIYDIQRAIQEEAFGAGFSGAGPLRPGDYDELGMCYKDIDAVVAAQADLVEPYMRLTPLAVVKG